MRQLFANYVDRVTQTQIERHNHSQPSHTAQNMPNKNTHWFSAQKQRWNNDSAIGTMLWIQNRYFLLNLIAVTLLLLETADDSCWAAFDAESVLISFQTVRIPHAFVWLLIIITHAHTHTHIPQSPKILEIIFRRRKVLTTLLVRWPTCVWLN